MKLSELFFHLRNPQVYTGMEINVIKKNFSKKNINICLVFPDKYEIGMSHSGIKILYHLLNQFDDVNAERSFLPEPENILVLKNHDIPLFSLENRVPLKLFDLIGFSILSELNFTNVLQTLALANIPLKSEDRRPDDPLIAAGSIAVSNPEPMREFIDFFAFGDGEKIFPEVVEQLKRTKETGRPIREALEVFENIEGVYVPSNHSLVSRDGLFVPDVKNDKIKKSVFKDFKTYEHPKNEILPITNVIFDRLNVEIARGCPQNCRFCQAKCFYSPFRFKGLKRNLNYIISSLKQTGYESFSLSSLSSGDYPYIEGLLEVIPSILKPDISFSLPSLRPGTLSASMLSTIASFRRTGITLVPEAGTTRLRRVINKRVTDEEMFNAVELALKYQWEKIKLYFIIGLPTETMRDVEGIVQLIEMILNIIRKKKKRVNIHVSFSSFVPKSHTPFQWVERESISDTIKKINFIRERLKSYSFLDMDFHRPEKGIVETILSRGDVRVGELICQAFKEGEIFSAWDADFNFPVWEKWITSLNLQRFLGRFDKDTVFPWDFITLNFRKSYLWQEYQRALKAIPTPSCQEMACESCQGCHFRRKQRLIRHPVSIEARARDISNYLRTRLFYEKTGDFRFFSHLSMIKYIQRTLRRSGLRFMHTKGFHPRMKIVALPPLPVYARGFQEVIEVFVESGHSEQKVLATINKNNQGFRFKSVKICDDRPPLFRDLHFLSYEMLLDSSKIDTERLKGFFVDSDRLSIFPDRLCFEMDYSRGGEERFSRVYRFIDPERRYTRNLSRIGVKFRDNG